MVIKAGEMGNEDAISLEGKINHYRNLIRGKFYICLIIHIQKERSMKDKVVPVES